MPVEEKVGITLLPRQFSCERQLMADNIKQAEEMLSIIPKNPRLFPTDSARSTRDVLNNPGGVTEELQNVANDLRIEPPNENYLDLRLSKNGLVGPSGDLKRQFLNEKRSEVIRLLKPDNEWNIDISLIKRRDLRNGLEALGEYFEGAATYIKSLAPGAEQAIELLSFSKQLCKFGAKLLSSR